MPRVPVAVACAFLLSACTTVQSAADIEGSLVVVGSSGQQGAIGQWESGWRKEHKTVSVNFSPDGEQVGKTALLAGLSHVAVTDDAISDEDLGPTPSACGPEGAFSVPTAIFPVSVVFNLAALKDVRLDGPTLAQIFNGKISAWDDPRIADLNPGIVFPSSKIHVVTARESTATNRAATSYLHDSDSDEWPSEADSTWPLDVTGAVLEKYSKIAQEVDNNLGSIAFLDTASVGTRFSTAALKFGSSYVRVSEDEYEKAAKESNLSKGKRGVKLLFSKADGSGYRLAAVGYQVFCYKYPNEQTARLVRSWGSAVLGDVGQELSSKIGGVASPNVEIRKASQEYLQSITSSTSGGK